MDFSGSSKAIISLIQQSEHWTVPTTDKVRQLLKDLGVKHRQPHLAAWADKNPMKALTVLGISPFESRLQAISSLEEIDENVSERLIYLSAIEEENPLVKQTNSSLVFVARDKIIHEIFSDERLQRIQEVMKGARRDE